MYGFKKDIKYKSFINDSINTFTVYRYGAIINFHKGNTLLIEGHYQIFDANQKLVNSIDFRSEKTQDPFVIISILDIKIKNIEIIEPEKMIINFKNNFSLVIFDNSKDFESCTINSTIIV